MLKNGLGGHLVVVVEVGQKGFNDLLEVLLQEQGPLYELEKGLSRIPIAYLLDYQLNQPPY
jgi:hypothetical protein